MTLCAVHCYVIVNKIKASQNRKGFYINVKKKLPAPEEFVAKSLNALLNWVEFIII